MSVSPPQMTKSAPLHRRSHCSAVPSCLPCLPRSSAVALEVDLPSNRERTTHSELVRVGDLLACALTAVTVLEAKFESLSDVNGGAR